MTEPLEVDPPRLKAAGNTLRGLVFPAAPAPILASGTDAVSAAINQTLPIIESPVLDTLSDAKAALTATGSNIVTAANMYAETDRTLGDHVGGVRFLAAGEHPARGASADGAVGATADKPADGETPGTPDPAPQPTTPAVDQLPTQVGQLAAMAGAMAPVTQQMQTVMSTVQGAAGSAGSAGAAPPSEDAQLVDETKTPDAEEDPQTGSLSDGATSGDQASGTVPVQPTIRPETAPSEIRL
ncbi:hypothetical protein [Mycobacterium sp. E796]|uniref:hypothetical protein n=1 Tax=Mycobacterium sp. E796 TaxID=1834151 RepID=UPI000801E986|nr:hypothetical protein [Mycobacterium sp. E796]OBI59761.1 hypothetical protein A5706_01365 [Mycobacterium sp. E796]